MHQDSLKEMKEVFDKAFNLYPELEKEWIASRFGDHWRKPAEVIASYAQDFDHTIEEDRRRYLEDLSAQNEMLRL
ncbi:MAG: hypothetical protein K2M39_03090 [Muribaculaceae bacterium]|nr:hypothetical protein [Muribaculaceae bacterium]